MRKIGATTKTGRFLVGTGGASYQVVEFADTGANGKTTKRLEWVADRSEAHPDVVAEIMNNKTIAADISRGRKILQAARTGGRRKVHPRREMYMNETKSLLESQSNRSIARILLHRHNGENDRPSFDALRAWVRSLRYTHQ